MRENLIEVRDLCKFFPAGKGNTLKAVDHVNLTIRRGETVGLVGESGCGKTTCGRTILKLYTPTSGEILFDGEDISKLKGQKLLQFKKRAQMIFQDPYSSLDSRMTIGEIIAEGMKVHYHYSANEQNKIVGELLNSVGLSDSVMGRFPHELSGGQRQRVGIARALAVNPDFIVCDEPISALDVSIQAQVVNLLIKLQRERKLTYLFISHDLSMVRHISDRVGVMYLGSLVELTDSKEIFENAMHPYTQILLSAIPLVDSEEQNERKSIPIQGEVPSPIHVPTGCKFHTRCPYATKKCSREVPVFREVKENHFVACHNI